jgi:predicted RNase H-like nuclease (RuvC/YqgF family)
MATELSEILRLMHEMKAEMHEMKAEMQEMKGDIKAEVAALTTKVEQSQKQIEKINETLKQHIPNFEKAGSTFEIVARSELRLMRGLEFSRPFMVKVLPGLARLALPKGVLEGGEAINDWHTHTVLSRRVDQLAPYHLA